MAAGRACWAHRQPWSALHSITIDRALHAGNLHTGKVKAGGSEVRCHLWRRSDERKLPKGWYLQRATVFHTWKAAFNCPAEHTCVWNKLWQFTPLQIDSHFIFDKYKIEKYHNVNIAVALFCNRVWGCAVIGLLSKEACLPSGFSQHWLTFQPLYLLERGLHGGKTGFQKGYSIQ